VPVRPAHPPASEHEADRVARQIRTAAIPGNGRGLAIQPHPGGPAAPLPGSARRVVAEPGQPLAPAIRAGAERQFGRDFTSVRVHAGPAAADSARGLAAHAYTVGSHIVFGRDQYAPNTDRGRHILAHELTHVVQQQDADGMQDRFQPFSIGDLAEAIAPGTGMAVDEVTFADVVELGVGLAGGPLTSNLLMNIVHEQRQLHNDGFASIKESPQHVLEFFATDVWDSIKEHYPTIILVTGGLLAAEAAIGALAAAPDPTLLTKVVSAILQIVVFAVLGYFAAVESKGAYDEGSRWLEAVGRAKGDSKVISEASRHFVRMVWHIVMAVLTLAGVRARVRGAALPAGVAEAGGGAGAAGGSVGRTVGGAGEGADVIPINRPPTVTPKPSPSGPVASGPRGFRGGAAPKFDPFEQPLVEPVAPPEPAVPAEPATTSPAATTPVNPGPGVQVPPAAAAGTAAGVSTSQKPKKRPPFVLRLPQEKAAHLGLFQSWLGVLQSDPTYLRGAPAQRGEWLDAHRLGGSDPIDKEVYDRGHDLGFRGAEGEDLLRIPNWSRTRRGVSMEVDHIVELQLTPSDPRWREHFDSMANYELLDRRANGSAGPRLRGNVARERALQVAFDPTAATRILRFESVVLDGGSPGEHWTSDEIRHGEQLDAWEEQQP
jgi:hypothetical protein